mgnify:CR=1 FL=1
MRQILMNDEVIPMTEQVRTCSSMLKRRFYSEYS